MAEKSESKEIREAIQAGEAALSSLRNAQEEDKERAGRILAEQMEGKS